MSPVRLGPHVERYCRPRRRGLVLHPRLALLIATTDRGDQLDLLVVSPVTPTAGAEQAMATAADPTNTACAPGVLAAAAAAPVSGVDPCAVWDDEGGRIVDSAPARSTNEPATTTSS